MTRTRRQALGQHFLIDGELADRIVEAVGATGADLVCEIGAGPGILTERLVARAGRLVALEIDPALLRRLSTRAVTRAALDVRLADARVFPYETLAELRPEPTGRVLVVGNLPYAASKAILLRLFEARARLDVLTLMLQREVAERLTAAPGGRVYGALSVLWQVWAELALLERVPPEAFHPAPAVESAVIQVRFRASPRPLPLRWWRPPSSAPESMAADGPRASTSTSSLGSLASWEGQRSRDTLPPVCRSPPETPPGSSHSSCPAGPSRRSQARRPGASPGSLRTSRRSGSSLSVAWARSVST